MGDAGTNPPQFGGNPGEPVPKVDTADLKAIWQLYREVQERHGDKSVAVGYGVLEGVCKTGADVHAVAYRAAMLGLITRHGHELTGLLNDGQLDDAAFNAAAQTPMEWMGVGIVRQGLPFDVNEFMRLLHAKRRS
jgi:hypothetical protein